MSRNSWAATASESGSPLVPIYGSPVLDSRGPCSIMAHIASCMSDADVDRLSIGSYIARSVSPLPVVDEVSAFLYIETSRLPHDQVLACVLLYAPSPSSSHLRFIIIVWLDQP